MRHLFFTSVILCSIFTSFYISHTLAKRNHKKHNGHHTHNTHKHVKHGRTHKKKVNRKIKNEKRSRLYKRTDIEKDFYLALLKRSDIADDLYKNVLPYIKEVAQDAAKTKEEIRQHKHSAPKAKLRLKQNKNAILKELDKKVLPWLDDITDKVNSLSQGSVDKFKEDLQITVDNIRKMRNHDGETKTAIDTEKESKKKKNNGQPNLLEYDENNKPILRKDKYKEKFEEFIKSKIKENKKNSKEQKKRTKKKKDKRKMSKQLKEKLTGPSIVIETNDQNDLINNISGKNASNINKGRQETQSVTQVENHYATASTNQTQMSFQLPSSNMLNQQISGGNIQQTPMYTYKQQTVHPGSSQPSIQTNQQINTQPLLQTGAQALSQQGYLPPTNNIASNHFQMPVMTSSPMPQNVDVEANKNIEFEVAELTNHIAEFQQEMDSITQDMANEEMNMPEMNSFRRNLDGRAITSVLDANNKNMKKKDTATLIFGGNVGFHGIIRYKVEAGVCTYNESFDKVRAFLKTSDHVIVNLDSSIMEPNSKQEESNVAKAISYAGIDTIVLANARLLDFGPESATHTIDVLEDNQLLTSGVTKSKKTLNKQIPVVYATNGITIALLSYCMNNVGCKEVRSKATVGPAVYDDKLVKEETETLRESGIDVVIVYLHWGNEDNLTPTHKIKDIVKKLSPLSIDVLVGCHPYVESHYYFRGMLVFFSLGNFLSPMHVQLHKSTKGGSKSAKLMNQLWDKQNERWETPSTESKLLSVVFNREGLVSSRTKYLELHMSINKRHCPQPQVAYPWIEVCSKSDKHCEGMNHCNEVECGNK